MGTLKRALLYITRKKGRSIILLLVFFAQAAFGIWRCACTGKSFLGRIVEL
jgi:hypothetical protein